MRFICGSVRVLSFISPWEWFTNAIIWWMFSFFSLSEHWLSKPITTLWLNHVNHIRKKKFRIAICGNKLFDYHFENCFKHEQQTNGRTLNFGCSLNESKTESNGIVHSLNESSRQQLLHIKTWFSCVMHNFELDTVSFCVQNNSEKESSHTK